MDYSTCPSGTDTFFHWASGWIHNFCRYIYTYL